MFKTNNPNIITSLKNALPTSNMPATFLNKISFIRKTIKAHTTTNISSNKVKT
jgi:hypothetical protein